MTAPLIRFQNSFVEVYESLYCNVLYEYIAELPSFFKHRKHTLVTMTMKSYPYEQDVAAAETYSHSSHEEDDYDNEDSIVNGEEEEQPFWRQHLPAILIAFMAAVAGHVYNQQKDSSSFSLFQPNQSTVKHPHVEQFVRTSNISFCQSLPAGGNKHLKQMDFYIPQEQLDTLQKYYLADETQDDMYEQLHYDTLSNDPDFECLQEQQRRASSKSIKFTGKSYYYKVRGAL
jgi:hypothetical protein